MKLVVLFTLITLSIICAIKTFILNPPNSIDIQVAQEASITPIKDINYRVKTPLIVFAGTNKFTVPEGFTTDLASIPRPLWVFIAPLDESYVFPAILHDYLYTCPGKYSRQFIDSVFYSFLKERGANWITAAEFYFSVRLFGESHFNKNHACTIIGELQNAK